jgi:hypothetical protein
MASSFARVYSRAGALYSMHCFCPMDHLSRVSRTIPSENVTHIDSQTLTLAPTDTSTIDPALFTNLFCDVNFNCTASPGGIVSGTWTRTKFSSSHSVFSTVSHTGPVQTSSHGSMDDFSANAQFSILGDGFQGPGDIGTQHNTQITVTVP